MKKSTGKLFRTMLGLSILSLVVGSLGYFLALQNISADNSKDALIQSWLRGDVHRLEDPKVKRIFAGLADKLVRIGEDVKQSDSVLQLPLVTPDELRGGYKAGLHRRAYVADTEVNLDVGLVVRAIDARYRDLSAAINQGRTDTSASRNRLTALEDRERFSKGLYPVYSVVISSLPNARSVDQNTYSDVLLKDYFGVYDTVKEVQPEIQVGLVYIASAKTGTIALYPALNSSLEIPFDNRPWYSTSIGDQAYHDFDVRQRLPEQGEQVTGRTDVGLTPFYGDYVSGSYTRTLWHRFQVETPSGVADYVVCVDVILKSDSWVLGLVFSNASTLGKFGNSVITGLALSLMVVILGTAVRYISRKPITEPHDELDSAKPTSEQYYSCFISYSAKDEQFARKLHKDLLSSGVPCWFAPHDIRGGAKIHEQIFTKIEAYDRLLLILSKNSMSSNWVGSEIAKARELERREGRRVLFPIRLVSFDEIQTWSSFDADIGKDSAREIREYFIPDFSEWKNKHKYNEALARLLKDFRAN